MLFFGAKGDAMIGNRKLKKRDLYLGRLIAFQDTEPVKVVTGIRRCGKSSLLKLMVGHLKEAGVPDGQIVEMDFESLRFGRMTAEEFYGFVRGRIAPGKRTYLFFDEVQRVPRWEEAVNSFRVDFDCDIYLTGSNAYLLSSEYSTYLSGRCVQIGMLPLSFREFLDFHGFTVERGAAGAGARVEDGEGRARGARDLFDLYLRFGGMPGVAEAGLDQERALVLLEGIFSTVFVRDLLDRGGFRGRRRIADPVLLRKIILFLADNIGSGISATSIGHTLENEGLLDGRRRGKPSAHTVQAYVEALLESYLFYGIKRFDIKGKEYLRTLGKYYIADIGLRNHLLGFRNRDGGHILENIVYFELLRRGYDLAIGKIGRAEIDFVATAADDKMYVQVTESMAGEETRRRELAPLRAIPDNYPKLILSLEPGLDACYDGIRSESLVEWLLEEKGH